VISIAVTSMAVTSIAVTREVRAPAPELWDLLVDWPRHAAWVPFTSMSVDAQGGHAVGSTLVGRTTLGRIGFDDVMRVTDWRPPAGETAGVVRIAHVGNVIGGTAEIEVRAVTTTRCVAVWREDVQLLPRLPRRAARVIQGVAGPPTALAGRIIFGRVLRRAADQAEQAYAITRAERR
jgi:polyketide cyclase/dehydrase/lipid transport protein